MACAARAFGKQGLDADHESIMNQTSRERAAMTIEAKARRSGVCCKEGARAIEALAAMRCEMKRGRMMGTMAQERRCRWEA